MTIASEAGTASEAARASEAASEAATTAATEEIVNRALTVINSNNEWIECVKNYNDPRGFLFCPSDIINDIGDAIDEENPIHSGASIAMCLQECKTRLNVISNTLSNTLSNTISNVMIDTI